MKKIAGGTLQTSVCYRQKKWTLNKRGLHDLTTIHIYTEKNTVIRKLKKQYTRKIDQE